MFHRVGPPLAAKLEEADAQIVSCEAVTQRWAALALGVLACAGGLWALHSLTLRTMATRLRAGFERSLEQRERRVRRFHDALLQGVQGMILRFQLIADEPPQTRSQRALMEAALDRADDLLDEARDRIQGLHATELAGGDLEAALANLIGARQPGGPAIGVFVEGQARPLARFAGEQVLLIVRDVLRIARRRAGAECIEIRVTFSSRRLTIAVVDDGLGIELSVVREGRVADFAWGRLRARARRLQARLRVDGAAGAGLRLVLTVPARIAFRARPVGWKSFGG
ncbi:MAG: hypothetical protein EON95_09475 [Caulobacteraceae bacterium]|nr:MAG: hypothetical protein EON95_09475 [Caulobacteraceae bacterium]